MTLANATGLMRTVSSSESFAKLLEQAKSGKNLPSIRTYLHLLEEYSTYMTAANKQKTLALLYEMLMHPEGDVRRAIWPDYGTDSGQQRSQIPERAASCRPRGCDDAHHDGAVGGIGKSLGLLHSPLPPSRPKGIGEACPADFQFPENHLQDLFAHCSREEAQPLLRPLLQRLWQAQGDDRSILVDALYQVPWSYLPEDALAPTVSALGEMLSHGEVQLQLGALRCLEQLRRTRPEAAAQIIARVEAFVPPAGESFLVLDGMRRRVLDQMAPEISGEAVSDLYLSDLKNAIPWTVKLIQID